MYKTIVAKKVRGIFAALSAGSAEPMLNGLASSFTYRFAGTSALSGNRSTRAAMERWWERIFRLFPGAVFSPAEVVVQGHPGNTKVATHVWITIPLANGTTYRNEFMQLMTLRFGKVTAVQTLEDTAVLDRLMADLARDGVAEATASPITD